MPISLWQISGIRGTHTDLKFTHQGLWIKMIMFSGPQIASNEIQEQKWTVARIEDANSLIE